VNPLGDLAAALRADGGLLAGATGDPAPGTPAELGELAAAGPRAAGHEADYALVLEAAREGYVLHYGGGGRARVLSEEDPDLALLAGDRLYALGLARLAELGDTEAVVELADVISLSASAEAGGRRELAEAAWRAGARAIGHGASAEHRRAKEAAAAGQAGAERALAAVLPSS
jgi:hypothetical protein